MKHLPIIIVFTLTFGLSGCSTFKTTSSDSSTEANIVVSEAPLNLTEPLDSITSKENSNIKEHDVTVPVIDAEITELGTTQKKTGSAANNDIPLEKTYPFQTTEPRFSVVDKNKQNASKNQDNQKVELDVFKRIVSGYQLDTVDYKLVKKHRDFYLNNKRYVERVLERSRPYLFFIVEEIEKRGLPMELALLPAIESAYLTNATSKSNAAGLWQFIPATGRFFGLKQNWWSDQRRDVILSTRSALDYLKELNIEFNGDWHLSIAAYNGGRGTISRAIKRNRDKGLPTDYFSLKLSRETTNYVPKLLAFVDVVRNASLYNVNVPKIPNFPYFTLVKTSGQIDMPKLIDSTALNADIFYQLNAGFKRWASSPEGPHRVVVPLGSSDHVEKYLAKQPNKPKIQWRNHKLKKGDTLYDLAREYKVSVRAIKTINNMKSSHLRAGKTILIPLRSV